ncbi:MAG: short-chain dehydrogenase [Rickettsiales bacterium]|nr:short-chain dehydrogenase [Rickettsiales bacterium]
MNKPLALLTGASKGIGYATAEILAKNGYDLIINSRHTEEAVEKLRKFGTTVEGVNGNLGDAKTVETLVYLVQKKGYIDALLLNHGGPPVKPFMEVTDEEWGTYISIMLTGPLKLFKALVPLMQKQKKGRVVAITSFTVKSPYRGIVLSNSLRAALVNALKTAAMELGGDGILINMVAPGYIATQRILDFNAKYAEQEGMLKEDIDKRTLQHIPLGKFGMPEDVGSLIVYLLSEENKYITGQNIHVDGGLITAN